MNKFIKIGEHITFVFDIEEWGIGIDLDLYNRLFSVNILCFSIKVG